MIEPYQGRVYDPAMGSGGFFVSSERFIEEYGGKLGNLSVYGQESNPTTWRLAAMNMAIRGIDFNFGKKPACSSTSWSPFIPSRMLPPHSPAKASTTTNELQLLESHRQQDRPLAEACLASTWPRFNRTRTTQRHPDSPRRSRAASGFDRGAVLDFCLASIAATCPT